MDFGVGYFPTHDVVAPYDLFVALTAAAQATSSLRVGSGICLVVERDPITTAKEVASIDHLSGGRFEFGVGAGWNREEKTPHPPILVGGLGPTVLDRVLAFGDAWFPNYGPEDLGARIAELRERAGRPIEVSIMGVPPLAAALEPFAEAGCRRVVHWIPSGGRGVVEPALERWESAIAQLHGEA